MTSPLAADAPSRRVLMSPSLFLVLRIWTFGIRFMYPSSGIFRCSARARGKTDHWHRELQHLESKAEENCGVVTAGKQFGLGSSLVG